MVRKLSQAVIDRLMKKYKRKRGTTVGDSKQIAKAIRGGAKVPTFAKKGGHVRKKTKKKK